jgi:N,N'-diacetylchitobiose transport system substrate-binding protein
VITSPAFLGGSNLAVAAKSKNPELAYDLLKIMASDGYQKKFAELGLLPAKKSLLGDVGGGDAGKAQAAAAQNTRFVPSSENWAAVEATSILPDMIVAISGGADVAEEAAKADAAIEEILNG